MTKAISAAALMLGILSSGPAAAETFRCGSWIATPEMTVEELLDKCGEPTTKTVDVVDVYGPNASGAGNNKRGTVTVEKWTYDRGSGSFDMIVTIEDGVIKRIDRGT